MMAPPRKRRFATLSDDLKAKRAREQQAIKEYNELNLDDSPEVIKETRARLKALIEN
jgi:hypothetical protein